MSISVRSLSAALVALAGAAPLALAQPAGFEGVVAFKMTGKDGNIEMTQMYKGMKTRTEVSKGGRDSSAMMWLPASPPKMPNSCCRETPSN